jgi:hypothetical protein
MAKVIPDQGNSEFNVPSSARIHIRNDRAFQRGETWCLAYAHIHVVIPDHRVTGLISIFCPVSYPEGKGIRVWCDMLSSLCPYSHGNP